MAKFTESKTYEIHCPACDSARVVKDGFQKGTQRYECKDCRKKFRANGKAQGRRMDEELMGSAIRDFYAGRSYKQIAKDLKEEYDIPEPSKSTIYEWVKDYTDEAMEQTADMKAQVGDEWVSDEIAVKVGSWEYWNWNVLEKKMRYILASHLSRRRTEKAAIETLEKDKAAAGREPNTITSGRLRSYGPAIKKVFPKTLHIKSQGLTSSLNNNMSEQLQGTYRSRIKTMRGLDSLESGQRNLDGWTITCNHMRGLEALKNDTPGKRAKASPPFTEWADVAKGGAVSPQLVSEGTRLADTPQLKPDAKPEPRKKEPSRRSKAESVSRTPCPAKPPTKAKTARAQAMVKGRAARQHQAYKLRQRIRRSQKGGRR